MQAIARQIQILDLGSGVQRCELQTELAAKGWLNSSRFARFEEQAQPLVPKGLNHIAEPPLAQCSAVRNEQQPTAACRPGLVAEPAALACESQSCQRLFSSACTQPWRSNHRQPPLQAEASELIHR